MPLNPKLSLVIAVYNKPDILRLVLAACARQSFTDFEVIVADDGSGPAIAQLVGEGSYPFPVRHLWHEDAGWRKNTMLNKAILAATADHIVFIDGDCLPSRHFLLDHWNEREPHRLSMGRRVEMSRSWSQSLTMESIVSGEFEHIGWSRFLESLRGDARRVDDGMRMPSAFLRRILLRNLKGLLGSNFSIARSDLEAVNGFDELYHGPGCGEDSDLQYRLSLIGIRGKSLRNLAIQFHMYHPLTRESRECWERFQAVKERGEAPCRVGLRKPENDG